MTREITLEFGGIVPGTPVDIEENIFQRHLESASIVGLTPVLGADIEEVLFNAYNETVVIDSGLGIGQQWLDSRISTLIEDDSLFFIQSNELVTTSTEDNIISHFVGQQLTAGDPATWSGYEYTGQMKRVDIGGGIGVTFHSQHPTNPQYYRVRMFVPIGFTFPFDDRFHLTGDSAVWDVGAVRDSGITPAADIWYSFHVLIQDLGGAGVRIQANTWADDDGMQSEPAGWQMDATDTAGLYPQGRVGVWCMALGDKRWKDLQVNESGSFEVLPLVNPLSLSLSAPVSFLDASVLESTQITATLTGGGITGSQDVSANVAWTSSSPTHLTIDTFGVATSADPGTSSTVTITADYLGLTETLDILVISATAGAGQYQNFATIDNITWFFDDAYLVEPIINGRLIVRAELDGPLPAPNNQVVVNSVTPPPTGTRSGSMVNPPTDAGSVQSYDNRAGGWNPAFSATYPVSLNAYDSLISTRSFTDAEWAVHGFGGSGSPLTSVGGDSDRQPRLHDASILTCLPRVGDGGPTVDPDTFRPTYVSNFELESLSPAWQKPVHHFSTINVGSLPALDYGSAGGGAFYNTTGDSNPYIRYTRVCNRDWLIHVQDFEGRQVHPKNNMPGYWEWVGDNIADALVLAFITDPTTVPDGSGGFCSVTQRQALLRAVLQVASDNYYCGELIGNSFGATYGARPGFGSGSWTSDSSHYTDLSYIFAHLFSLAQPTYAARRPDGMMYYNDDIVGGGNPIDSVAPSSLTDEPFGTLEAGGPNPHHLIVTGQVGVGPSPEAQVMIGDGSSHQVVDPTGLPAPITQGLNLYPWIGMPAQANRRPQAMTMWQQHNDVGGFSNTTNEHANPREWYDLFPDRGNGKTGLSLESYRRSNVHIQCGGLLCGQAIMGRVAWEAWRNAPKYLDYMERWMFKENLVHGQNEAYVIATQNANQRVQPDGVVVTGETYGFTGGEKPPGQAGSGFVTNMFNAYYDYVF